MLSSHQILILLNINSIEEQTLIQKLPSVKYRAFDSITDCALAGGTSKIALVFNLMLTTLHNRVTSLEQLSVAYRV